MTIGTLSRMGGDSRVKCDMSRFLLRPSLTPLGWNDGELAKCPKNRKRTMPSSAENQPNVRDARMR